jgi:predicted permease
MVKLLFAAFQWLPIVFDWIIVPVALVLLGLSFSRRTRRWAATGFLAAAAGSAALLSLLLAASVFHLLGYGRAIADLLLNFGPAVTGNYIGTLMQENAPRLVALIPMVLTMLLSSTAAIYLRRKREEGGDRAPRSTSRDLAEVA